MFRNICLGGAYDLDDFGDAPRFVTEALEDGETQWVPEGAEERRNGFELGDGERRFFC